MTHWLTCYDPDDGEPYGTGCDCAIGDDHDGDGNLSFPEPAAQMAARGARLAAVALDPNERT